jgi:DNA-binding transcriptional LysR family regulator
MKQSYTVERGALGGIEAFLRVAERQSFRQAADDMGVSPSAVSQAVRALEARVGVALFSRTTRSVGLTEAGARFLAHAQPAFDAMLAASDAAKGLAERPSGLLRLAVPRAVVPLLLEPILASFCAAYPEVTIEIAASEELVDLAKDGFDAGVRMGPFIAEDMVTVRLSPPFRLILVGAPAYLDRMGRPESPDRLADHACIRIRRSSGALGDWRVLIDGRPVDMAVGGPMIANDFPTILGAALAGVGLAQVPAPIALEHIAAGTLEEVLQGHAPQIQGVFLFFSERRQVLPKLRAFIEHVKANPVRAPVQLSDGERS